MQRPVSDKVYFAIGSLEFPRVRSNFTFECKPIYTNNTMTQTGVTSEIFIRDQIVISGVNFDPCSISLYRDLCAAMHIGQGTGGPFNLTFFNIQTGAVETKAFIVKSLPVTVLCVKDDYKPPMPTADGTYPNTSYPDCSNYDEAMKVYYGNRHQRIQLNSVKFEQI